MHPGSVGYCLRNRMREKDNDGTFAAQPRTLAAMSALPISIDLESI